MSQEESTLWLPQTKFSFYDIFKEIFLNDYETIYKRRPKQSSEYAYEMS
jgi:hypothetical protein